MDIFSRDPRHALTSSGRTLALVLGEIPPSKIERLTAATFLEKAWRGSVRNGLSVHSPFPVLLAAEMLIANQWLGT
jgi:hypothetical protein